MSSWRRRRIKSGASNADVLRVLRRIKRDSRLQFTYEHVDAHQDRHKLWWQMTLEEQLNYACDILAKSAVSRSMVVALPSRGLQLLPLESAAVFVQDNKLTTDVSKEVRFALGEREARDFYTRPKPKGQGWTAERFDQVDFASLNRCLDTKPDMFGIWLSKQSSGFCATRKYMACLQDHISNKCPNCGRVEDANHLCRCPGEDRTRLLQDGVDSLRQWMLQDGRTEPDLAFYIPKYIMFRGTRRFSTLGPMSVATHAAAMSQDLIGWREFMEGKVSKLILQVQMAHCAIAPCMMTGDVWMRQFINHLLHLTHSQWIFRNITLHDRVRGTLRLKERRDVLVQIEQLLDTEPEQVPQESRFLLEMDYDSLYKSSFERQSYWVIAMQAARRAGRRTAAMQSRRGAGAKRRAAKRRTPLPCLDMASMERQLAAETSLRPPSRRRGSVAAIELENPCNKRLKKPD